jgi:hypothetical protein
MREKQAPVATERPKRTPINKRDILSIKGKEPGYHYRIVNDTGDRIATLQDAGYELVEAKDVRVGDKRINNAAPEGSLAQVSVGGGQKAFVMRIKEEWYHEDQQSKEAEVKKLEQSMLQQALAQNEIHGGKLEITKD